MCKLQLRLFLSSSITALGRYLLQPVRVILVYPIRTFFQCLSCKLVDVGNQLSSVPSLLHFHKDFDARLSPSIPNINISINPKSTTFFSKKPIQLLSVYLELYSPIKPLRFTLLLLVLPILLSPFCNYTLFSTSVYFDSKFQLYLSAIVLASNSNNLSPNA